MTSCDAALLADTNAGLPRAGSGATDFAVATNSKLGLLSDFAGIDMPGYALSQLVRVDPHWCFEVDPAARRFLIANHPSAVLGGSVVDRDAASSPFFDIVVAGFPCQPFSDLGTSRAGTTIKGEARWLPLR